MAKPGPRSTLCRYTDGENENLFQNIRIVAVQRWTRADVQDLGSEALKRDMYNNCMGASPQYVEGYSCTTLHPYALKQFEELPPGNVLLLKQ